MSGNEKMPVEMPREIASAANLMVHPFAGAAAWSAFGVGLMSQAFGMWMGALNGVAEASQRLIEPPADDKAAASKAIVPAPAKETAVAPAGDIMPEDFSRPKVMERPEAADDLKAIPGIGPKLEQVLNGLGVWTYAQVAAWTPQEIAWVEDHLGFKGRVGRDGWLEQAASLARKH